MDATAIGSRVRIVRDSVGLSRKAFATRLGCKEMEIVNVEFGKLKKPELKESLYRNISAEFGISLDWLKFGIGPMDKDESITVSERVLTVRVVHGLTRLQMAGKLGIPVDDLRNAECNNFTDQQQCEEFCRSVAGTFGVSINWLKSGVGKAPNIPEYCEDFLHFPKLTNEFSHSLVHLLLNTPAEQLALISQCMHSLGTIATAAQAAQAKKED